MVGNVLTPAHLLIVLAVALIVLGPKRLPAAGRGLGEAMRGFKDALTSAERSDTTDPQIPEGGQIVQANAGVGAGTTPPGSISNTATPTRTGEFEEPSPFSAEAQAPSTREGTEPTRP